MENKMICDVCGGSISMTGDWLKTRWLRGGIFETYFVCEHCGKEYRVAVNNRKIRLLIKQITKKGISMEDFNKLTVKIREETDKLKIQMGE